MSFFNFSDICHIFNLKRSAIFAAMKSFMILIVTLSMTIKPLWPLVDYVMNYNYIANVLCENKEKPELNCDGKCYLAEMLAKEAQQNKENPFGDKESKAEIQTIVNFQDIFKNINWSFYIPKQDNFKTNIELISFLFTTDVSHPPELV